MLQHIKAILKGLNIETSKSSKTSIKGCKNAGVTHGINIKKDKYNDDEVLVYYNKMHDTEIKKITNILEENGYKTDVVPGIIIVSLK